MEVFKDLKPHDLVAQVLENNSYEFVKPFNHIEQEYSGDMYKFTDGKGKLNLIVTPDKRLIFIKNGKTKAEEAKNCVVGYWGKDLLRSASATDKKKTLTLIERLKIAFQADGSFTTSGNKIRFSFSKQRKIDRLELILKSAGVDYKIYKLADDRVEFNIDINAELFQKDFDWVNTNNLCSNWCIEFIEELSHWDATRRSKTRFKFDTTVKQVVNIVELITLSAGYGVLISTRADNRKEHFSDVYTAHILKNNKLGGQSQNKEKIQYTGKVYNVQVPSGMLLVKRNNATVICGDGNNFD